MKPKRAVREAPRVVREAPAAPPLPPRRSPLFWIAVPLLALALLGQTGRMRERLTAGRMLRQVELVSMALIARGELVPRVLSVNLEVLRRAAALDPGEVGIPIARGTQYLLIGNGSAAAAAYRDALELEPRPEIHLNLGRALAMAGEMEKAREELRLAVKLDPNLAPVVPPEMR
jgi:tetratricopeptide (TPR) repeat protein